MIYVSVPVHSCEPSLDSQIKIIEVLVTSEMSENQAAPGTLLLHFYSLKAKLLMVLVFSKDGRKQNRLPLNRLGMFSRGLWGVCVCSGGWICCDRVALSLEGLKLFK